MGLSGFCKRLLPALMAVGFCVAAFAAPALAIDLGDSLLIHGYGGWSYKRVANSGYVYAEGTSEGNYTNVDAALNVSAKPAENLYTVVQASWQLREERSLDTFLLPFPPPAPVPGLIVPAPIGTYTATPTSTTELDYAFAEWHFADELKLRAGQVKLPFGIYTEIWDVGTLRPFLDLPHAIYGAQGLVAEAYQGGGLTGTFRLGNSWALTYDVYAGQVISDTAVFPTFTATSTLSDVIGGRMALGSARHGLSMGVSGYIGARSDQFYLFNERGSVGIHFDYAIDGFEARTEVVYSETNDAVKVVTGYAELSYRFFERVQIAARVELNKSKLANALFKSSIPRDLDRHEDYAVGLNYWFSDVFVIKSAYHFVRGNRYSAPIALFYPVGITVVTPYTGPQLDNTNHLFEAGAQFSF